MIDVDDDCTNLCLVALFAQKNKLYSYLPPVFLWYGKCKAINPPKRVWFSKHLALCDLVQMSAASERIPGRLFPCR